MNETDTDPQLTVLAVDDEKPALDELAFLLRAEDSVAHVHTASDATTALRILRGGSIDAVFLDINMPGLDGLELAGILSNFATPPPVVFVTAHDDRAVDAFDLGAVDYLLKPLREERLAQAVQRIVGLAGRTKSESKPEAAPTDEVIPVELGGVTTLVQRSSVEWVEADGTTRVCTPLEVAPGAHPDLDARITLGRRGLLACAPLLPGISGAGHRHPNSRQWIGGLSAPAR